MRVIKFRAWDGKKIYFPDYITWDGRIYESDDYGHSLCMYEKKNHILMQFTGLMDKNGTEIYEGDILKFIDDTTIPNTEVECITEVFWWNAMSKFSLKNTYHEFNFTTVTDMEVIGNIYENIYENKNLLP